MVRHTVGREQGFTVPIFASAAESAYPVLSACIYSRTRSLGTAIIWRAMLEVCVTPIRVPTNVFLVKR